MNEEWIEQMQKKMADYQWPAPELSWEELDQALTANNPRKPRMLWLQRMAAAAVVLLIAGVGYWGFLKNHRGDRSHDSDLKQNPIHERVAENHGDWHNDRSATKIRVPVHVILASSAQKPCTTDDPLTESIPVSITVPDTILTAEPTGKEQPHATEEKTKHNDDIPPVIYPSDLHQRKHIDYRLTAKIYMSSTMAGNQTESLGLKNITNPRFIYADSVQTRHRQPIRFGLSLRYRLNDCWSIESGLIYTHFSSDITTKEKGVTTMTEQRLNYIGLPLNISYDLWKNNHFGLYVTTGGTIEKGLDTSPWQFSLNGAVGAEYKLTDFFSLYAEPGLGYYFKDGSTMPTIYQDRPLNFNLSVGLRFNLK